MRTFHRFLLETLDTTGLTEEQIDELWTFVQSGYDIKSMGDGQRVKLTYGGKSWFVVWKDGRWADEGEDEGDATVPF